MKFSIKLIILTLLQVIFFNSMRACEDKVVMDAQTGQFLEQVNSDPIPPMEDWDVAKLREFIESHTIPSQVTLAKIEQMHIPIDGAQILARIYTPFGKGPFPVLISIHGGGWVFGSLNSQEPFCREIASKAHTIVVSVDYRLAPENPFPIALNDCYHAAQWVKNHIADYNGDPNQISIEGDSAGGNLAAAVALKARDENENFIKKQILIYPATNNNFNTLSYLEYANHYFLNRQDMMWFWKVYLGNEMNGNNPYAAPLKAKDFSRLPQTLIILAHFDPLRDEGKQYGEALSKAGNRVSIACYPTIHAFVDFFPFLDIGKQAIEQIVDFL